MPAVICEKLSDAPPALTLVREQIYLRKYRRGETIFLAGEQPEAVYSVRSGLVKLVAPSVSGREVITELYFPGEVFTLLNALHGEPYPCSGICLTDCELEVLSREAFQREVDRNAGIFITAMRTYQNKVRFQRHMLVELAVGTSERRAAMALLMLVDHLGSKVGGHALMPSLLTRQEFSEVIGTTVETAVRILSRFRKEGILSETAHTMTLDLAALRKLSGEEG
ncbi:MAG: Crp/Fnr family transcriptional regulator [Armatimonadetes bacterium]|nr:Crp/Fnr family transcriptional regulator [Armatimonadota bacterium]